MIQKLLLFDMRSKPSSYRRWNEIFRLSTPDSCQIQEIILFDTLQTFEDFPLSSRLFPLEVVMNFLRNTALLLEQVLDKVDINLDFCVKAIHALHALNYKCPPEVRARLRETSLPEMRNSFIVRCLLLCFHSNAGDLYMRALAISEINPSLHGYITTSDTKLLQGHQVLLYVLSLFVEAADDFEAVSNIAVESFPHHQEDNSILLQMNMLLDVMQMLIAIVQSFVVFSPECRKCVSKLTTKLSGDVDDLLLKSFLNTIVSTGGRKDGVFDAIQSIPDGGQSLSSAKTTTSPPTTSWWYSWGVGGEPVTQGISNVKVNSGIDFEIHVKNDAVAAPDVDAFISEIPPVSSPTFPALSSSGERQFSLPLQDIANNDDHVDIGQYPELFEKLVLNDHVAEKESPNPSSNSFLAWYCANQQRIVRLEFKNRLHKEINPILRQMEKMHDRIKKRQAYHDSGVQDKLTKDNQLHDRLVKEARERVRTSSDKCMAVYLFENKLFSDGLSSRLDRGQFEFDGQLEVGECAIMRIFRFLQLDLFFLQASTKARLSPEVLERVLSPRVRHFLATEDNNRRHLDDASECQTTLDSLSAILEKLMLPQSIL